MMRSCLLAFVTLAVALASGTAQSERISVAPPPIVKPANLQTPAQGVVSWEYDQVHPRVAYCPQAERYLVVWEDHHWGFGNDWDIYGRFVSADGVPLGTIFGIAWEGENKRMAPAVVCNEFTGEFLVVWEYAYSQSDHDIYGRLVAPDGTLLTGEFPIATTGNGEYAPAVCHNVYRNQYLVAYEYRSGTDPVTPRDVVGRVLAFDGSFLSYNQVIATTADESQPDVAYDIHLDQYAVVYRSNSGTADIHGRLLASNGSPATDPQPLVTQPGNEEHPAVALDLYSNEFFVVAGPGAGGDGNIQGRYFSAVTGVPSMGWTLVTSGSESFPRLAWVAGSGNYFMPYEHEYSPTDHDIMGWWPGRDSGGYELYRYLSTSTAWEGRPDVAYDGDLSCLLVWEDGRYAGTMGLDIWSSLQQVGLLTGRVYEGYPPSEDHPRQGVRLELYGSQNPAELEQLLGATATGADGWYRLRFYGDFEHYSIIEEEDPYYLSTGASSPEGVVVHDDWIRHDSPTLGVNHTGNRFWDLYLVGVEPGPPAGGPLTVSAPWPNPSREGVALSFQGGAGGSISLEVLDVAGRVVRRLSAGRPASGKLIWDGRGDDGRSLPPGVYHLRVRDGASEVVRRAVLVD